MPTWPGSSSGSRSGPGDGPGRQRARPRALTGTPTLVPLSLHPTACSARGVLPVVAPLSGFALGVAFAWVASDELARAASNVVGTRSLVIVTLFGVLVPVPITAYFLILAQDWSLAYLVEGGRLASTLRMGLVLLAAVSTPIGFRAAARPAAARNVRAMVGLAAVPALLATALVTLLLPRLSVFGTFAQFHGDFGTRPVAGSFVGTALLWMHIVLVGTVVWTIRSLKRLTSRHARR